MNWSSILVMSSQTSLSSSPRCRRIRRRAKRSRDSREDRATREIADSSRSSRVGVRSRLGFVALGTSIIRIWTAASRAPRRVTAAMFRHRLEHHTGRLPRPVYDTGAPHCGHLLGSSPTMFPSYLGMVRFRITETALDPECIGCAVDGICAFRGSEGRLCVEGNGIVPMQGPGWRSGRMVGQVGQGMLESVLGADEGGRVTWVPTAAAADVPPDSYWSAISESRAAIWASRPAAACW